MSSEAILRPEILVVGNRSYRVNPSSLPGLEPSVQRSDDVYREEVEADYYPQIDPNEDEPNCRVTFTRTTTETVEPTKPGNDSSEFPARLKSVFSSERRTSVRRGRR